MRSTIKKWCILIILILFVASTSGCAGDSYKYYAQAIKEQQVTQQLMNAQATAQREDRQRRHELKMTELMGQMTARAAASEDKTDDMMVPLMLMIMEDKFQIATLASGVNDKPAPLPQMKAPETTGEMIRASTGLALGLGGMALGAYNSNQLATVATAGIAGAGVTNNISGEGNETITDSYKANSQNTVTGDANTFTGNVNEDLEDEYEPSDACAAQPGYFVDEDGVEWVGEGISCDSWLEVAK